MAKKQAASSGDVKARLLVDCHAGKCGAVIQIPPEAAAELVAGGFADINPDAVAYAESQLKVTP